MSSAHDNNITGIEFFNLLLNPSPETVRKIGLVKKLLKDGWPLYRAIREAKLGWKNYYKYAPLIYGDPNIPIPIPKTTLRDYRCRGIDVEGVRVVLDCVAKHEAARLVRDVLAGGGRSGGSLKGTLEDTGSSYAEIYRWCGCMSYGYLHYDTSTKRAHVICFS